jgi:hypothetical protein
MLLLLMVVREYEALLTLDNLLRCAPM